MRHRFPIVAGVAVLLAVAACSAPDRTPEIPTGTAAPAAAPTAATRTTCTPGATASFRPAASQPQPKQMPAGTLMKTIQDRGYLLVGTSSDTRLLSTRSAAGTFDGFDVAVAQRIAQAIFGDSKPEHLRFRAITAADRIPFVNNGVDKGGVDLVARAMTVTCDRWQQVNFSAVYFQSTQQVLVRQNAGETTLAALDKAGRSVCATGGSTSYNSLAKFRGIKPVAVRYTTDCLALWQQGKVAAITGDDAILAGLVAQDPSAVVPGGENIEQEPYGIAVAKAHPEFAQFINGVLEQMRRDGGWGKAYTDSGLAGVLKGRTQPTGDYSRPLP